MLYKLPLWEKFVGLTSMCNSENKSKTWYPCVDICKLCMPFRMIEAVLAYGMQVNMVYDV